MDLLRTHRLQEKLSADPHIFYLDELSAKGTLRKYVTLYLPRKDQGWEWRSQYFALNTTYSLP